MQPSSLSSTYLWFPKEEGLFKDAADFIKKATSLFPQIPFGTLNNFHSFIEKTAGLFDDGIIGSIDMGIALFFIPLLPASLKNSKEKEDFFSSFPYSKKLFETLHK